MKTKTKTRVLSLLLTLAMLLTSFVVVIPASAAEEAWDGEAPAIVDGAVSIGTESEFAGFFKALAAGTEGYAGANVTLTADIDLAGKVWTISGGTFYGTFDGQNHTISNLKFALSGKATNLCMGLFASSNGATVKNVDITVAAGSSIVNQDNTGTPMSGVLFGNATSVTVENVAITGSVSATFATSANWGTFAGQVQKNCVFVDCYNDVDVNLTLGTTTSRIGGFVGMSNTKANKITFVNCESYYDVTFKNATNHRIGGFIGVTQDEPAFVDFIGCVGVGQIHGAGTSGTGMNDFIGCANGKDDVNMCVTAVDANVHNYTDKTLFVNASSTYVATLKGYDTNVKIADDGTTVTVTVPEATATEFGAYTVTYGAAAATQNGNVWTFTKAEAGANPVVALNFTAPSGVAVSYKLDGYKGAFEEGFEGGSGTEQDPYIIANEYQLLWFARSVNAGNNYSSKFVKLADNAKISYYGVWYAIGWKNDESAIFKGTFDGNKANGASISIGFVNQQLINYSGFFGMLTEGPVIKNLDLTLNYQAIARATVTYEGAFAQYIYSGTTIDGLDLTLNGSLTKTSASNKSEATDKRDYNNDGDKNDTVSVGVICNFGALASATGKTGESTNPIVIANTTVGGTFSITNKANMHVSPFIANVNDIATQITNSSTSLNLTYTQNAATSTVLRYGGAVACQNADLTIANFVNSGTFTPVNLPTGPRVGGIIGDSQSCALSLNHCYSTAEFDLKGVKLNNTWYLGSIIGRFGNSTTTDAKITNCFGYGALVVGKAETSAKATINGVAGSSAPAGNGLFGLALDAENATVYVNAESWATMSTFASVYYNDVKLTTAGAADANANAVPFVAAAVVPSATAKLVVKNGNWSYTFVADEKATWIGFASNAFANNGTGADAANSILVNTAAQLARHAMLANMGNNAFQAQYNKFIKLGADIDVSLFEWMPIQQNYNQFKYSGTFDGDNHTITGLKLTRASYAYTQSMFGNVTGTIKNLKVNGVTIVGGQTKGTISAVCALVGAQYGGTIDNVHVTNFNMTVAPVASYNPAYVGGLVGYLGNAKAVVSNSSIYGVMTVNNGTANNRYIGGVVARARYGTVSNVVADVDMNVTTALGSNDHRTNVGGVVGSFELDLAAEALTINNTVAYGDITVNHTTETGVMAVAGILATVAPKVGVGGGVFTSTNNVYAGTITLNSPVATNVAGAVVGYVAPVNADITKSTITITNTLAYNMTETVGNNAQETAYDAATNLKTEADALELTTLDGARVRIAIDGATGNLDNSGIRFDSYISADVVKALKDKGYTVTFGTVIAKASTLAAANGNWNALVDGKTKVVVEYDLTQHKYVDGDGYNFTGALIKVQEKNYKENLTAVAYMTITTAEGVSFTVYGDATTTRSIATVAERALADQKANYSDAQRAILETYLGK